MKRNNKNVNKRSYKGKKDSSEWVLLILNTLKNKKYYY